MKTIFNLAFILLVIAFIAGYVMNIYKLIQCDFEPSYKEEAIRIIAIPTGLGSFVGYMNFNDNKEQ